VDPSQFLDIKTASEAVGVETMHSQSPTPVFVRCVEQRVISYGTMLASQLGG
jgi:hypothetical protein